MTSEHMTSQDWQACARQVDRHIHNLKRAFNIRTVSSLAGYVNTGLCSQVRCAAVVSYETIKLF